MTPSELIQLRESMGLTQPQLAKLIPYTREHICRCENGKVKISKKFIDAVNKLKKRKGLK